MKIAFDWDGTTWGYLGHEFLQEMATTLKNAGWSVWIISAVPASWKGNPIREKEIELRAPDFSCVVVYTDGHEAAGKAKAEAMKELGIEWLVDDTEDVCKYAVENGVKVLQVR